MVFSVVSGVVILLAWVVLAIMQIWLGLLDPEVFCKITITACILLAVIIVVTLVVREYFSEKRLKKDGFID